LPKKRDENLTSDSSIYIFLSRREKMNFGRALKMARNGILELMLVIYTFQNELF